METEKVAQIVDQMCGVVNVSERATILAMKTALKGLKLIKDSGDVPDSVMGDLRNHINIIREQKKAHQAGLNARDATCAALVASNDAAGGPELMDGGGK